MSVDLRQCKPGDKLKTADGSDAEYVKGDGECTMGHMAQIGEDEYWYDDDGTGDYVPDAMVIVSIIPRETTVRELCEAHTAWQSEHGGFRFIALEHDGSAALRNSRGEPMKGSESDTVQDLLAFLRTASEPVREPGRWYLATYPSCLCDRSFKWDGDTWRNREGTVIGDQNAWTFSTTPIPAECLPTEEK